MMAMAFERDSVDELVSAMKKEEKMHSDPGRTAELDEDAGKTAWVQKGHPSAMRSFGRDSGKVLAPSLDRQMQITFNR